MPSSPVSRTIRVIKSSVQKPILLTSVSCASSMVKSISSSSTSMPSTASTMASWIVPASSAASTASRARVTSGPLTSNSTVIRSFLGPFVISCLPLDQRPDHRLVTDRHLRSRHADRLQDLAQVVVLFEGHVLDVPLARVALDAPEAAARDRLDDVLDDDLGLRSDAHEREVAVLVLLAAFLVLVLGLGIAAVEVRRIRVFVVQDAHANRAHLQHGPSARGHLDDAFARSHSAVTSLVERQYHPTRQRSQELGIWALFSVHVAGDQLDEPEHARSADHRRDADEDEAIALALFPGGGGSGGGALVLFLLQAFQLVALREGFLLLGDDRPDGCLRVGAGHPQALDGRLLDLRGDVVDAVGAGDLRRVVEQARGRPGRGRDVRALLGGLERPQALFVAAVALLVLEPAPLAVLLVLLQRLADRANGLDDGLARVAVLLGLLLLAQELAQQVFGAFVDHE